MKRNGKTEIVFKRHYYNILTQLQSSEIVLNAEFEVAAFMLFIADLNAHMTFGDRKAIQRDLFPCVEHQIHSCCPLYSSEQIAEELFDRMELYEGIIKSRTVRSDWSFGSIKGNTALSNAIIAFGDILINPACAKNYLTAPVMLHGATEIMKFAEIFNNVAESIANFLSDIDPREEEAIIKNIANSIDNVAQKREAINTAIAKDNSGKVAGFLLTFLLTILMFVLYKFSQGLPQAVTILVTASPILVVGVVLLLVFFIRRNRNTKLTLKKAAKTGPTPSVPGYKYCAQCGAHLESTAAFCSHCGKPQE